jgi:Zn2+/Cd2+-exporting ATPase
LGFLIAMLIGLIPIARRAISAARACAPFSIEMLMLIAGVGAVIIGATEEAG